MTWISICGTKNFGRPGTNNNINVPIHSCLLKIIVSDGFTFRLPRSYCVKSDVIEGTILYLLGYVYFPDLPLFVKPAKMRRT